jgi:hypothetical protein
MRLPWTRLICPKFLPQSLRPSPPVHRLPLRFILAPSLSGDPFLLIGERFDLFPHIQETMSSESDNGKTATLIITSVF